MPSANQIAAGIAAAGVIAGGIILATGASPSQDQTSLSTSSPTYFAHITNGVVDKVIVASPQFIATGAEGDPTQWVQTSLDLSVSEGYAGIGEKYATDSVTGAAAFMPANAANAAVFNATTNSWNATSSGQGQITVSTSTGL